MRTCCGMLSNPIIDLVFLSNFTSLQNSTLDSFGTFQ
jgi:hypothetical protein